MSTEYNEVEVRHPQVKVKLTGVDGNAFAIIAAVCGAMKHAGLPGSEIVLYQEDAMADDYDHLLWVTSTWVTVS